MQVSSGPPLSLGISKMGMLAKLCMMTRLVQEEREAVCSEASLTLETFGDQRTTNTRHR